MISTGVTSFLDLQRIDDVPAVTPGADTTSPWAALVDGARTALARARYRRSIRGLARLQPHLLRDMGFEPEAVYDATEGDWRGIDARGRRG